MRRRQSILDVNYRSMVRSSESQHSRPPLPEKAVMTVEELQGARRIHLQSADLFEKLSPAQKARLMWMPEQPGAFEPDLGEAIFPLTTITEDPSSDPVDPLIEKEFSKTMASPVIISTDSEPGCASPVALRIGVVLSGGPAPGGHNVISGIFDYIKVRHPESTVFGFRGGLNGVFEQQYLVVTEDVMRAYRNMGGFDMLWSGRARVGGDEDKKKIVKVCKKLELHGLIIVGGDGSNSNAAILAEYFARVHPVCCVIGVPKTIDGDLVNKYVETSFGFDTASRTYSELIGNLCTDVCSSQTTYHIVRVMGRSASHLVMECAMQTRPNMVFIGEEIKDKGTSLKVIVQEVVDLITKRKAMGKRYGIVLVPEGLIEFIPEMRILIDELNVIMKDQAHTSPGVVLDETLLTETSADLWRYLPDTVRGDLLEEREATGYVQVARVSTEKLLMNLVEDQLAAQGDQDGIHLLSHYFGYEGRCAMPTNFDANYCYALGKTAACLIEHRRTGFMAVVRRLNQPPKFWQPGGVPFPLVMEMIGEGPEAFAGVRKQLVDLEGPLFKTLNNVRDKWKFADVYRCPGPIQFLGPTCDIPSYNVLIPSEIDLLGDESEPYRCPQALVPKRLSAMSEIQRERLNYIPPVPALCVDKKAKAVIGPQFVSKDVYAQNLILTNFPRVCKSNGFHLCEVQQDRETPPIAPGLRVGVACLSRQAPGCTNVFWGLYERLSLVEGQTLAFFGLDGLVQSKYIELTAEVLSLYKNQGGLELVGRSLAHHLFDRSTQHAVQKTCETLQLDGLVLIGSSVALNEALHLTEYFKNHNCRTSVICVPCSGSNSVTHQLVETNIGFDTSSKVYSSLIGNVLTEAASMPKYWHFVRLMGKLPSKDVIECALQTHPNVVIVGEEYGQADKTLRDVVNDIADVVSERARLGKYFGAVIIPDELFNHLPNMKHLMKDMSDLLHSCPTHEDVSLTKHDLVNITEDDSFARISKTMAPWSLALFKSLPKYIRKELVASAGRLTSIETQLLLAQMVKKEIQQRQKDGRTARGFKFSYVSHFFGYQGRSSMPSNFDCQLAFAYGHLAALLVESGMNGYCCTIRGLCGGVKDWRLSGIPLNSMLALVPAQQETNPEVVNAMSGQDMPIIPSSLVDLTARSFRWLKSAATKWQFEDGFCNPGPVQWVGMASDFIHRSLHEEQAEYFNMIQHVQSYAQILLDTCGFGVDENFLKMAYVNLHSLLTLRLHPDSLETYLPQVTDIKEYTAWKETIGVRPAIWNRDTTVPGRPREGSDFASRGDNEDLPEARVQRAMSKSLLADNDLKYL